MNKVLLGQIMITTNKIFIHANFHVCFSFSFHYNALFVLIMISNTRSKRVNENITKLCTFSDKIRIHAN